jgi:hypothetical protein
MHPTLLIGPADWMPDRLPPEEYLRRLAQLWADHPQAGGAIVYGGPREHGALAYLTHFTPKLEPALALIAKSGDARLLVGGGAAMIGAARPLTFIEDLAPLRDAGAAVAEWTRALPVAAEIVLINGDAMTSVAFESVRRALHGRSVVNGDGPLAARMRVKSPYELPLIRAACAMLAEGVAALCGAFRLGDGVSDCVLQAEHVLLEKGAQDVRSLFSLDGGRTLRPFEELVARRIDPLSVYLAVCHDGYWVDTFCSLHSAPDPLNEHAQSILASVIGDIRPGFDLADLPRRVEAMRGSLTLHPVTDACTGRSVGLSLADEPASGRRPWIAGEVHALHVGLVDADRGAFASAVVAVTANGSELLWSTR